MTSAKPRPTSYPIGRLPALPFHRIPQSSTLSSFSWEKFTTTSRFRSTLISITAIPGVISVDFDLPLHSFDWICFFFFFANLLSSVAIHFDVYCYGCYNLQNHADLLITRPMWCAGLFTSWMFGMVVYEVSD